MPQTPPARPMRRIMVAGFLLGVALGGFFDGILLHQILQWHHLLSGVASESTLGDLRMQVLADGLFHALHYVLAVVGLWLLWRERGRLGAVGHRLLAATLLGFGGWHMLDAVLAHWILQLHRIRMGVENPLLWDLTWLAIFGIVPMVLGMRLLRRPDDRGPGGGGLRAAAGIATLTLGGALAAAFPPAGLPDGPTLAVFRPSMDFPAIIAAVDAVGGSLVWTDEAQGVWLIDTAPDARPHTLLRHGAILVSNGPVAAGCLSWTGI